MTDRRIRHGRDLVRVAPWQKIELDFAIIADALIGVLVHRFGQGERFQNRERPDSGKHFSRRTETDLRPGVGRRSDI